jgi:hypothetical protein
MSQDIKKINGVYMGSQEIASTALAGDANKVAYYKLEDVNDSSGNGYTLTNANTVTFVAAKFGNGASQGTSNTNKYLYTTNTMGIDGGAFSFVGNIKINTEIPSDLYTLFAQANNTSKVYYSIFYEYNGGTRRLKFVRTKQGVVEQSFVYNITLGTTNFYQIGLTYDGTNLYGYVNGQLVGQVAASGNGSSAVTSGFYLGMFWDGTSSPSSQISDDVYIASRALTSDEIYSLYKTGVKKFNGQVNLNPELESTSLRGDANLVQYTRFEGNSTATVGNNGTDTDVTYGTTYGRFGQGFLLNGTTTYVTTSSNNLGTGDFTISFWFAGAENGGWRWLFMCYKFAAQGLLITTHGGGIRVSMGGWFTDTVSGGNGVPATDTNWHQLVLTRSGTTITCYIDGVQNGSTGTSGADISGPNHLGHITGGSQEPLYFGGKMDEFFIESRALTATEISNLYNTNIKKVNGVSNV